MNETDGYHVGIILDGNGRWATNKKRPRLFGHNAGLKNIDTIVKACPENNVTVLTLYAFAIANWKRDKEEVDGLWNIFRKFYGSETDKMMELGVKTRMIGNRAGMPEDVMKMIEEAEEKTKNNTKMIVQVALNYDGVEEVVRATQSIAKMVKNGECNAEDINQALLEAQLDTAGTPSPDIVIRTGMPQVDNEKGMSMWRSSSFLQLQSAQSVCVSTPVLWPDFSPEDLSDAIAFAKPEDRLFGGQRKEN